MAYTIRQFINECDNYEYSQEYFDVLKESMEIDLMERYIKNQEFLIESGIDTSVYTEGYFMEADDKSVEDVKGKVNEKKKNWFLRFIEFIVRQGKRFYNALKAVFKSSDKAPKNDRERIIKLLSEISKEKADPSIRSKVIAKITEFKTEFDDYMKTTKGIEISYDYYRNQSSDIRNCLSFINKADEDYKDGIDAYFSDKFVLNLNHIENHETLQSTVLPLNDINKFYNLLIKELEKGLISYDSIYPIFTEFNNTLHKIKKNIREFEFNTDYEVIANYESDINTIISGLNKIHTNEIEFNIDYEHSGDQDVLFYVQFIYYRLNYAASNYLVMAAMYRKIIEIGNKLSSGLLTIYNEHFNDKSSK